MKEKITSAVASINALCNALVKDTSGDFDHSKISRTNALATHGKLVANLKLFKGLHENYCIHRERGEDDNLEEALLEKDEEYLTKLAFLSSMKSHLQL